METGECTFGRMINVLCRRLSWPFMEVLPTQASREDDRLQQWNGWLHRGRSTTRCYPIFGKRRRGAIERNGGSLDGGTGDRFRDRDQLGVKLACSFSDIGVVEAAHKRGWQVVGHARTTIRTLI